MDTKDKEYDLEGLSFEQPKSNYDLSGLSFESEKKNSINEQSNLSAPFVSEVQSAEKVSPYAPPSISEVKKSIVQQHDLDKSDIVKQKLTDVLLSDKSPAYKDAFVNNLSNVQGYDKAKIIETKNNIDEGKKILSQPKSTYDLGRGNLLIGNNDEAIRQFTQSLKEQQGGVRNLTPKSFSSEIEGAPQIIKKENTNGQPQRVVVQDNESSIYNNQETQFDASKNPSNALYGIGLAYMNKKEDANAQNFFIQSLKQDPTNADAMLGLANIAYKQGNKEESKKLTADAYKEYKRQALALQVEAEKKSDKEKQQEADKLTDIANGLEAFITGDEKMGVLNSFTPQGILANAGRAGVEGLKEVGAGIKDYTLGTLMNDDALRLKGATQSVAGLAEGAFGVAGAVVPELSAFNLATASIKTLPPQVKSEILSSINPIINSAFDEDKKAELFDKAIDLPFSVGTSILDLAGIDKNSTLYNVGRIANILIPVGAHKAFTNLKEANKAISDTKEIISGENKNPTEEQVTNYAKVAQGIKETNLSTVVDNLKENGETKLAKKIEEKTKSPNDELVNQLSQIKKRIDDPNFKSLSEPFQKNILNLYEEKSKELAEKGNAEVEDNHAKTTIEAEKAEIDSQIQEGKKISETATGVIKEEINKTLSELEQRKKELETTQTEANDTENIARVSSEIGGGEEPIKTEPNESTSRTPIESSGVVQEPSKTQEIAKQKGFDITEQEALDIDAIHNEMLKDNPKATIEEAIDFHEENKNGEIKKPVLEEEKTADLAQEEIEPLDEKRADYKARQKGIEYRNEKELLDDVLENSESPVEVAEAFLREHNKEQQVSGAKYNVFDENGVTMTSAEYQHVTGNKASELPRHIRDKYIDNSRNFPIDNQLQEIEGERYSADDFINHIDNEINRKISDRLKGSTEKQLLKKKYEELTGNRELKPSSAKKIIEADARKRFKELDKYIQKEQKNYEQAEREYYEAIKRGDIIIENGENNGTNVGNKEIPSGAKEPKGSGEPTKEVEVKSPIDRLNEIDKILKNEILSKLEKEKLIEEKNSIFEKNKKIKEVYQNFDNIIEQLENKIGEEAEYKITKKKVPCP